MLHSCFQRRFHGRQSSEHNVASGAASFVAVDDQEQNHGGRGTECMTKDTGRRALESVSFDGSHNPSPSPFLVVPGGTVATASS